jgi:uncharacterized glyoxalase superfamily protein PhnB
MDLLDTTRPRGYFRTSTFFFDRSLMKPTPPGWPRISNALYYQDPSAAIDWLVQAFGFTVRLKIQSENGAIHHSELTFGDGVIMVGGEVAESERPDAGECRSPRSVGGANTQNIMIYVDDVEAHCAHARAAGARITSEPKTTDYGPEYWTDRSYGAQDPDGHHWWFCQRIHSAGL